MNDCCDSYLEEIEDCLDVIAFGLRSFRDSKTPLIERKVQRGLKIRMLTMYPDSQFLKQREKDEKVVDGHIRMSIIQLNEWINRYCSAGHMTNQKTFGQNGENKL